MASRSPNMSASASSTSLEKKVATEGTVTDYRPTVETAQVDIAAQIVAGKDVSFTPEEAARIRYASPPSHVVATLIYSLYLPVPSRKIDWHLMPLMCSTSSYSAY